MILLITGVPVKAAGLDDADERLFHVQLAMAEKGDVRAQYYLGEMHEQGLGTRQNLGEAFKWYEKAAEKGDAWAKRKLVHRAEIEAGAKKEQAVENLKTAPAPGKQKTPENTGKNGSATTTSDMMAKAGDATDGAEKIKAVEREKRRAAVRAMILERIRHPVGEPFE
ncbi:tetratricopeptide repeat protein [Sulfuricaulis sp.]|jgi:TPR repeat protein|uniref:tetratricopeptide repeat protein n=1 Tax=Sulfuricaulis sp. TaxID=2003553 RepID=UPI003559A7F4